MVDSWKDQFNNNRSRGERTRDYGRFGQREWERFGRDRDRDRDEEERSSSGRDRDREWERFSRDRDYDSNEARFDNDERYGTRYQGGYGAGNRSYYGGGYRMGSSSEGGEYESDRDYGRGGQARFEGSQRESGRGGYRGTQSYGQDRGQHFGKGPSGYKKSDQRIEEDVCEALMRHGEVDASNITVKVANGEVTLSGHVDSRSAKHMAEQIAEDIGGVKDISNQLKTQFASSSSTPSKSSQASQTFQPTH